MNGFLIRIYKNIRGNTAHIMMNLIDILEFLLPPYDLDSIVD